MFRNIFDTRLFDAAGDAPNGGGAGSGDAPPPAPALTLDAITQHLAGVLPDLIKPLISTEVNGLDARLQKELKKLKKDEPTTPPAPGTKDGKDAADPFKADREKDLEARLLQIENERAAERTQSLERETDAEVKTALADFTWDEKSEGKSIAFDWYRNKAKRDEDGNLVIGSLPLAKFIKEHAPRNFKNFFASRDIGGAGSGKAPGAGSGRVTMDKIRVGMSKDDEAAIGADIASALAGLRNR